MLTVINEIKNKNGVLKIGYDRYAENPRELEKLGKMVCFHKRYSLGDSHDYNSSDYSNWDEVANAIKKDFDVAIMLPLYLYDHSHITISTSPFSCPWDSGQVGWIFATKEDIRKEFGAKRISKKMIERAEEILRGEVQMYDKYISGEVYGYVLEDKDGNIIDSCSNFLEIEDMKEYLPDEYQNLIDKIA